MIKLPVHKVFRAHEGAFYVCDITPTDISGPHTEEDADQIVSALNAQQPQNWHYESSTWVEDMTNYRWGCTKCNWKCYEASDACKCPKCGAALKWIFNDKNKIFNAQQPSGTCEDTGKTNKLAEDIDGKVLLIEEGVPCPDCQQGGELAKKLRRLAMQFVGETQQLLEQAAARIEGLEKAAKMARPRLGAVMKLLDGPAEERLDCNCGQCMEMYCPVLALVQAAKAALGEES